MHAPSMDPMAAHMLLACICINFLSLLESGLLSSFRLVDNGAGPPAPPPLATSS